MRVYTHSEALQKLAEVLDQAKSIEADVSTDEIVAIVRKGREKSKAR